MKSKRSLIAQLSAVVMAGMLAAGNTIAASPEDAFPDKPIRMIVPFSPGGFTDYGARLLAQKLSQELKQPVIVENKVGAGSSVGTDFVARSAPDGYTLLVTTQSFSVNPFLFMSMNYDSARDFRAVSQVAISPMVLYTNPKVPADNLKELVKYLNDRSKTSFGSAGVGSAMHLAGELFRSQTGTQPTHVPYRGESAALTDLIAGNTDFLFGSISSSVEYIKAGRIKAIAYFWGRRSPLLPEVPTSAEAGFPNLIAYTWIAVIAPAKTPDAIVNRLNASINKALSDKDAQDKLRSRGMEPVANSTPASTRKFIDDESSKWGTLLKKIGVQPQ